MHDFQQPESTLKIHFSLFQKWHECVVTFSPPALMITEYEDLRLEVSKMSIS